jgi:hypothetical protein
MILAKNTISGQRLILLGVSSMYQPRIHQTALRFGSSDHLFFFFFFFSLFFDVYTCLVIFQISLLTSLAF